MGYAYLWTGYMKSYDVSMDWCISMDELLKGWCASMDDGNRAYSAYTDEANMD